MSGLVDRWLSPANSSGAIVNVATGRQSMATPKPEGFRGSGADVADVADVANVATQGRANRLSLVDRWLSPQNHTACPATTATTATSPQNPSPSAGLGVATDRRPVATPGVMYREADERPDAHVDTATGRTQRDPAWWRCEYEKRTTHWQGCRRRSEAESLAWRVLENRWNLLYGERVPREQCAGCGRPIGAEPVLDLIDGNRVHDRSDSECLIRHGERWRAAAAQALTAMGLPTPNVADAPGV